MPRIRTTLANPSGSYLPLPSGTAAVGKVPTVTGTSPLTLDYETPAGVSAGSVFSPLSYGGVGLGATDDTTAIQNAFAALKTAGGGVLDLGAYKWGTRGGIVLQSGSNFTIRGPGAQLIPLAPTSGNPESDIHSLLVVADCTDFTVEGFTLDGLRDTLSPDQFVQSNITTGDTTVTISDGTKYLVNQYFNIYGGLTANSGADANKKDIQRKITAVNGNVLTFTPAVANSYTGTGASGGVYVTRYQPNSPAITVAGRTLSGEDIQNGLHLISCQRFKIRGLTSRNTWQSPIKCGTGFESSSATDGCTDGTITGNVCQHAYDQGVSLWLSSRITVADNVVNDAGWGGVVLTESDDCTVTGNTCTAQRYQIPADTGSGAGIVVEGGARNVITGNICRGNTSRAISVAHSPMTWGISISSPPTISGYQVKNATTLVVSSSAAMQVNGRYSIYDGAKTERITVQSITDSTHVVVTSATRFDHASGCPISSCVAEDNLIRGNTCVGSFGTQNAHGVWVRMGVRTLIDGNICQGNASSGIYVAYQSVGTSAITAVATRISNNLCSGNGNAGRGNIHLDTVQDVIVEGNVVGGSNKFSNELGIGLLGVTDVICRGNRVSRHPTYGIYVGQGTLTGTPQSSRVLVQGNHVSSNESDGIYIAASSTLIDVADNQVVNQGGHGINANSSTRCKFRGNTLLDNKTTGLVLASMTYCIVTGNTATDDGAGINPHSGLANAQTFGITESGTADHNVIVNNSVYGNGTAQITTIGAATVTANNI